MVPGGHRPGWGVDMKVLWLCNMVLPAAARELGMEASVKEGWVSHILKNK